MGYIYNIFQLVQKFEMITKFYIIGIININYHLKNISTSSKI